MSSEIDPLVADPIRRLALEAAFPGSRVLYIEHEGEVKIILKDALVVVEDLPPLVCIAFNPSGSVEVSDVYMEPAGFLNELNLSMDDWIRLAEAVAARLREAWVPSAHRRLELSRLIGSEPPADVGERGLELKSLAPDDGRLDLG